MSVSIVPHPWQHWLFSLFLIVAILMGVRWLKPFLLAANPVRTMPQHRNYTTSHQPQLPKKTQEKPSQKYVVLHLMDPSVPDQYGSYSNREYSEYNAALDWIIFPSSTPNSRLEALTPNMMVLKVGSMGGNRFRWGWCPHDEISVLIRRNPRTLLAQRRCHVSSQCGGGHWQPGERALTRNQPCWRLDLGLLGSRTVRK